MPKQSTKPVPGFLGQIREGDVETSMMIVSSVLPPEKLELKMALVATCASALRRVATRYDLWPYLKCMSRALYNTLVIDAAMVEPGAKLFVKMPDGTVYPLEYKRTGE